MYSWCICVVCLWSNSRGFCSKQRSRNKLFVYSEVGFSLVRLIFFVRIFSRPGPSFPVRPVLGRTLQLEQMEITAHGAESSCACASVLCCSPRKAVPSSPATGGAPQLLELHVSTAGSERRGWQCGTRTSGPGLPPAGFASSWGIAVPCAGAQALLSWELLSDPSHRAGRSCQERVLCVL